MSMNVTATAAQSKLESETIALNISIIYFVIYGLVFLIASIYSAYEVESQHHIIISRKTKPLKQNIELQIVSNDTKQTQHETESTTVNDPNQVIDAIKNMNTDVSCFKRTISFIKYWGKALWDKKSVYFDIIPHLFDQATDMGVVYKYYEISQQPETYRDIHQSIDVEALLFTSVGIIIGYKIISSAAVYALTRRWQDLIY
eukprot:134242_1